MNALDSAEPRQRFIIRRLGLAAIVALVSREMSVPELDILSERRNAPAVLARHTVMWLARHATTLSLPGIGRALGRDHTTVLHGVWRIERDRGLDPAFQKLTDALLSRAREMRS
jgi:chromosomal replication initiator protein